MNRLERFMHEERYMRNGKLMLNLLRYDIQWVVGRWGFLPKTDVLQFFQLVAKMFEKDLASEGNKQTPNKPKKDTLPSEDMFANANANKK